MKSDDDFFRFSTKSIGRCLLLLLLYLIDYLPRWTYDFRFYMVPVPFLLQNKASIRVVRHIEKSIM